MSSIQFLELREKINIIRVQTDKVTGQLSRLTIGTIRKHPEPARITLKEEVSPEDEALIEERLAAWNDHALMKQMINAVELPSMARDTVELILSGAISDELQLGELERAARQLVRAVVDSRSID